MKLQHVEYQLGLRSDYISVNVNVVVFFLKKMDSLFVHGTTFQSEHESLPSVRASAMEVYEAEIEFIR